MILYARTRVEGRVFWKLWRQRVSGHYEAWFLGKYDRVDLPGVYL